MTGAFPLNLPSWGGCYLRRSTLARGGNRGGRRVPNRPAAASGPGRMSQRTDGGPASSSQPIREIPADDFHGQRQQLTQQQSSAPLRAGGPDAPAPPPPGQGPEPQRGSAAPLDVFGPSERPEEPPTEGAPLGPGKGRAQLLPDDPYQSLRAVYAVKPHPDIAALLERAGY